MPLAKYCIRIVKIGCQTARKTVESNIKLTTDMTIGNSTMALTVINFIMARAIKRVTIDTF